MLYPIFRGLFPWKQDASASGESEAEPEAEAETQAEPKAEPEAEAEAEAETEPEAEAEVEPGRRLERGLEGESWGPLQAAYYLALELQRDGISSSPNSTK